MTYVEGASLHQDRGGATVFARYAFNELWSFVAGWAILLDYVILRRVTAFTATNYLAAFWAPLGRGALEIVVALAIIAYVAWRNIRGFARTPRAAHRGARRRRPRRCRSWSIVVGLARLLPAGPHHRPDPPRHDADVGRRRSSRSASRPSSSPASSRRPAWRARCAVGAARPRAA